MIYILIYGLQLIFWFFVTSLFAYAINRIVRKNNVFPIVWVVVFILPFGLEAIRYSFFYSYWMKACERLEEVNVYKKIDEGSVIYYEPGNWRDKILWKSLAEGTVDSFIVHGQGSKRLGLKEKQFFWKIQLADKGDIRCGYYEKNITKQDSSLDYMQGKCVSIEDVSLREADIKIDHRKKYLEEKIIMGRKIGYGVSETFDVDTDKVLKDVYYPVYQDNIKIFDKPTLFQLPISYFGLDKCKQKKIEDTTDLILFAN